MNDRMITAARAVALSSEGAGNGRHRIGSVIFKRNHIYAAKANGYKTHTKMLKYSEYPFLHAECYAIFSHGIDNCDGMSILTVRVDRRGNLTMAKPCHVCDNVIGMARFKKVYYSDWNGKIQCH